MRNACLSRPKPTLPASMQRECDLPRFENVSLGWIRANLRQPSPGLLLFLLGLNTMLLLPVIFPGASFEAKSAASKGGYAMASALLMLGGLYEATRRGMWAFRHQFLWVLTTGAVIVYMLISGILMDPDATYVVARKDGIFVLMLMIPAVAVHRDNWPWLWLTFIAHAVLGLPLFYVTIISGQITSRFAFMTSETSGIASVGVYLSGFLFMMLPVLRSRWLRYLAILLFCTMLLRALLGGQRGPWFHAVVMLAILVFIYVRVHGIQKYLGRSFPRILFLYAPLALVLVLVFGALLPSLRYSALSNVVTSAYGVLENRMTKSGSATETIMESDRWVEFQEVASDMNSTDWMIGKGLNATWSSGILFEGAERGMVHNTWLNCFFWGGVGLFLAVSWPLLWALRVIFFSKTPAALCCAGYAILMYWTFLFYRITEISPSWILFCLAVGVLRWEIVAMRRRPTGRAVSPSV